MVYYETDSKQTLTSTTTHLVLATNLSKVYNGTIQALDNVTLEITPGITALIGPNGAGKSTFLKVLLGLLKPTQGTLQIFGLDSWSDSVAIHENLGVIHEKHVFPDQLTVERYLEISTYFFDTKAEIDVSPFIALPRDRKIKSLSAGMHRKLCLLQCFLGNPKLVIMDEPTANLDPLARKELLDLIKQLHEQYSINFIISSHILSDLENIATNVIVLNKGVVKFQGKYSDLLTTYFSNTFELYVENTTEWTEFLLSLPSITTVKNLDNKILLSTAENTSSNELLTVFFQSPHVPASDILLFRKVLDLDAIFE